LLASVGHFLEKFILGLHYRGRGQGEQREQGRQGEQGEMREIRKNY